MLLCLLMLLPWAALCDESRAGVTITYIDNQTPLEGARFHLHRVADMDEEGCLELADPFTRYPVRIEDLGNQDEAAKTLEGYIRRDKIEPLRSAQTDQQGKIEFTWKRSAFEPGAFLLISEDHKQDGYVYRTLPVLFALPYPGSEDDEWNYEIQIRLKADKQPDVPPPDVIKRKVLKIWKAEDDTIEHPQEVTVQLLCDGEIFDTQKLNAGNNWGFEWPELDGAHEWTLTEEEMDGYRVSIERIGVTFVVTNTYDEEIVLPTPTPMITSTPTLTPTLTPTSTPTLAPGQTPTPTPAATMTPEDTVTPTFTPAPSPSPTYMPTPPPKPTKTPRPRPTMNPNVLPQTGQVWWPVPALLVSGTALVLVGLIRRRGDDDED